MMRRGVRTRKIVRVCAAGKVFCVQYQIAVTKTRGARRQMRLVRCGCFHRSDVRIQWM